PEEQRQDDQRRDGQGIVAGPAGRGPLGSLRRREQGRAPQNGAHRDASGRVMDIAEMNSEEKMVLTPMMVSVAAKAAHSGLDSGRRSERTHRTTTAVRIPPPASVSAAPSSRAVSRRKCR